MPGCGMHSRPKLAEKARNNSLLKITVTTTTTTIHAFLAPLTERFQCKRAEPNGPEPKENGYVNER